MIRLDFWIWLAVAAAVHWALPTRHRLAFVATACLSYLAWLQPGTTATFAAGVSLIHRALLEVARARSRTLWITLVVGLSSTLAAWKFLPTLGIGLSFTEVANQGLVPLGLSYLIFKLLHLTIEIERRTLPVPSLTELFAYLFFVPMFSAGPIERLDHFRKSRENQWTESVWVGAGTRIVHGLVKKFALSEGLLYHFVHQHGLDDPRLDLQIMRTSTIWLATGASYLRIYLDFSGYSDLAIGSGRLLGFRLMENFNWPILATSPSDFWRRWHISLSQWCQHYIYMTSMGWLRSPILPLFMTFLVMGAWHIASWNRVGWAVYQTIGVLGFMGWSRMVGRPKTGCWRATRWWKSLSLVFNQAFVFGGVVFFMNGEDQSLGRSLSFLLRLAGLPVPHYFAL